MNTAKNHIQEELLKIFHNQGITEVGFARAKPLIGYADFIMKEHKKYEVHFDNSYGKTLEDDEFYNPNRHLESAKSIITMIMPYHMNKSCQHDLVNNHIDQYRISKASVFKDYHHLVEEILQPVSDYIKDAYNKTCVSYCDTGPLNDKAVLLSTGDFKLLRNSLLWHKIYGSRFYIGYIITDLNVFDGEEVFDIKEKFENFFHPFCKTCGRCAKACPNQAINEHGHLNSRRCVSYLTQANTWTKLSELGDDLTLKGYIYGCDICQMVCPLNGMDISKDYSYKPVIDEYICLADIENLTNRQFKSIYNESSAGWIGKKRFIRNMKENER